MNSRARNRLVGVTILILIIAAAVFFAGGGIQDAAYSKSVKEVAGDTSLDGKRLRVTGTVVAGSWDKKTNPMTFAIREEGATGGPEIKVVYTGNAPNTFGNDTVAILTGVVEKGSVFKADDMITKCPSKYSSKSGAATVTQLKTAPADKPIRVVGFLKAGSLKDAGSAERFLLASAQSGGDEVPVGFEGAMPAGTKDGVQLVVFGKMEAGVFVATEVALSK